MRTLPALFILFISLLSTSTLAHASDWSGIHLGVNGTYTVSGMLHASRDGSGQPALKPTGPIGGVQIGYQQEFGSFVFGLEADAQLAHLSGHGSSVLVCPAAVCGVDVSEKDSVVVDRYETARLRFGFDAGDYLPYVTGGYAHGHADGTATFSAALSPITQGINADGWVAGTGIDYRLNSRFSARTEYVYTAVGRDTAHFRANVIRFGVNYRF